MAETAAIDDTISGVSANSYVSEQEAIDYLRIRPGGEAWAALSASDQRGHLLFAAIMIEREVFWGQKVEETQALKFPRSGDADVPLKVQHAQIEQALDLMTGNFARRQEFLEMQSSGVRQSDAGDTRIRMFPFHAESMAKYKLCSQARTLLNPYIEHNLAVVRA